MKLTIKKALALVLCLLVAVASLCIASLADTEETTQNDSEEKVEMKRDFAQAANFKSAGKYEGYDIVCEDDKASLLIDTKLCTIAVLNKESGKLWKSNLSDEDIASTQVTKDVKSESGETTSVTTSALGEAEQNVAKSQLTLTYYDQNNHKKTFSSYEQGILNNKYEITNIDNGVMVQYNIGKDTDDFYCLQVMREQTFNRLKEKMTEAQVKKFESFYQFKDKDSVDKESALALYNAYPILKTESIYILNVKAKLQKSKFVKEVLYDLKDENVGLDWVLEEYKACGYTGYTLPDAPNFDVTVNYTLNNGSLNVTIPENGINYTTTQYDLTEVTILPYFGAELNVTEGDLVVPDGSGALISMGETANFSLSMPFYGNDNSMRTKEVSLTTEQVVIPAIGMIRGNDAFVANVVSGAEVGSFTASMKTDVTPIARINTTYLLTEFEEYTSQGSTTSGTLIKYAKKMYSRPISLDYYFTSGEKANYSGLAEQIRNAYFGKSERTTETNTKFLMETYGGVVRKELILSYPIYPFKSFTTVKEAQNIYDTLRTAGINNIDVKYSNWSLDKYRNNINKIGNVSSVVGSASEWKTFSAYLKNNNSQLYAAIDTVLDKNSGIITDATWHDKQIDGTLVEFLDTAGIYSKGITDNLAMTVTKSSAAVKKINDILKKLTNIDTDGVALDSIGRLIFSDYNEATETLRDVVVDDYEKIMQATKDSGKQIMVGTGNAYTYQYASMINDLPMGDSRYYYETEIPFVQMVLHGYVTYTGSAINLSDNIEIEYLKAAEYGAGLSYVLNDAEPKLIKDTNYSELYTTLYTYWMDDAVERYTKLDSVLSGTQSSTIVGHEEIQDNVFKTTYDNGVSVVVNYNLSEVTVNGKTIGARDFVSFGK